MWPSIVGILAIVGAVVGVKHWMGNNEYKQREAQREREENQEFSE
ncbi:hypothetical protein J2S49_000925 [Arcanobacterium wilhelmae]|uniref:Uncharacterized protein n=1 Tax=Arcanobacterium wilhelmae TaxID=1803177 RepID=A0ABT9NAV0_9ACTO|nr:hypothetical protein [Arcanobacterium wilhelmae]MDP9800849.1 hypothetical protein [Arcanobacterium wilhelmae]WFN90221.1 hypothetical protein P8A24_08555 [Arcanobacterium wilhelmae]